MVRERALRERIGEYLAARPELTYLDAQAVADDLRQQFPEYSRRKRRDFTALCRLELQSQGVDVLLTDKPPVSRKRQAQDDDEEKELVVCDARVQAKANNRANSSLRNFYGGSKENGAADQPQPSGGMLCQIERKVGRARSKQQPAGWQVEQPTDGFSSVGAYRSQLTQMCQLCVHLKRPAVYSALGIRPPAGFLLHGPAGCGKTLVTRALAAELHVPLISIAAPSLVAGVSGESEGRIRELFAHAKSCAPCLLVLDELDVIAGKREHATRDMERRIVAQLLACLDELTQQQADQPQQHVLVIGVSSRVDNIDAALRRAGRFDREIGLGVPGERDRRAVLEVLTANIMLDADVDLKQLARLSPGYVGADLDALCREASMTCVRRALGQDTPDSDDADLSRALAVLNATDAAADVPETRVCQADFVSAMSHIQPSAKREGFATVPDVGWEQVGALHAVRDQLKWSILYPIKYRDQFLSFGLTDRAQGILLAGPPGCGKTLLAKAVANETGMNFISVKGPELLSMYVGESERAVRALFQRARNSVPCVVFFDEIDALCPRRQDGDSGGSVRVVNQLLTELDGLEARKQVFVIAATNRPDMLDPALLRPGRLDKTLHVTLPGPDDRYDILSALTSNFTRPRFADDVDLRALCSDQHTAGFSGADLAALVRESSVAGLQAYIGSREHDAAFDSGTALQPGLVAWPHVQSAMQTVAPSVNERDRLRYDRMRGQKT